MKLHAGSNSGPLNCYCPQKKSSGLGDLRNCSGTTRPGQRTKRL